MIPEGPGASVWYAQGMATISTQSPLQPTPARVAGTTTMAVVTAFLLAFPLIVTAAITPKFEQIFRDFGVALPLAARLFINIGRFLSSPLGWVVVVAAIGLLIVPASILAARRWSIALILFLGALVWFLGYILLLIASMFGPLMTMIESLQAGGKV